MMALKPPSSEDLDQSRHFARPKSSFFVKKELLFHRSTMDLGAGFPASSWVAIGKPSFKI